MRNHSEKECRWNTGGCFRCGETGHKIVECPKMEKKDTTNKGTLAALNYGRVYKLPIGPDSN